MKRKLHKYTQNYPTERKDYPSSELAKQIERQSSGEQDQEEHGRLSIEDTVRIESYDLPTSAEPSAGAAAGPPVSPPVNNENEEKDREAA